MELPTRQERMVRIHPVFHLHSWNLQHEDLDRRFGDHFVVFTMPEFVFCFEIAACFLRFRMGVTNCHCIVTWLFMIVSCRVPLVLALLLVLFDIKDTIPYDKRNPNFVYGLFQAIIAVSLLVLCFIGNYVRF